MGDTKLGLSDIQKAYLGTGEAIKMYLGTELVHGGVVIPGSGKQIHSGWVPENDNIVAYWRFDESIYNGTAGEAVATVGAPELNGTANSSVLLNPSPIVPGNMVIFPDGNASHIYMTDSTGIMNFQDDFSLSCWVYIHENRASGIFERGNTNQQFSLLTDGGYLRFRVANDDADVSVAPYIDNWIHVVCLYQRSTKYADLYVNGTRVHWITCTNYMNNTLTSAPVAIGALTTASATHNLNGSVDELCLWKTLLTETEITTIYNHQKP